MSFSPFEVGDIVSVHFHGSQITLSSNATIIRKPTGIGDFWILKCSKGFIHFVSEDCTVTRDVRAKQAEVSQ